jgi:dTDP-4-amino-4,6-dideoxygalactose transaminase
LASMSDRKVPLLNLKREFSMVEADVRAAMERVLATQMFILGPEVEALERQVADYSGVRFGVGMSSGTDALLCTLMALGVGSGDEVITSPFTFFATAGVIRRLSARPVFIDIEPDTFNMDPGQVRAAITSRTKAILPVHLFGQCAEMDPIRQVASERGLPIVEDAAQSIGSKYHGRRAGTLGDAACFSFFPSKNLGAYGDGGMIVTNDEDLAKRCRSLRQHGEQVRYHHAFVGGNFRLDALQAAVVGAKLKYLDSWTAARRAHATFYNRAFAGTPVTFPTVREYNFSIYNQYVIRVPRRDAVIAGLTERGIASAIYYPVPLHLQECFADLGYKPGDLPHSEQAAREVLAIPIHPYIDSDDQKYVIDNILRLVEA